MINVLRTAVAAVALVSSGLSFAAPDYDKVPFSFYCVSTTDCSPSLSGQLLMQVIGDKNKEDPNTYFKLFNNVGIASSVTLISFDGLAPGFLHHDDPSNPTFGTGPGTEFMVDVKGNGDPGNLPAGANVVPPFVETWTARAVSQGLGGNGQPANGIDASNDIFEMVTPGNYLSFINSMKTGDLRIGLHVTAMPDGKSATYINNLVPVPEPETFALLIVGLGFLGYRFSRRRLSA
jgi:hypothetical protein